MPAVVSCVNIGLRNQLHPKCVHTSGEGSVKSVYSPEPSMLNKAISTNILYLVQMLKPALKEYVDVSSRATCISLI